MTDQHVLETIAAAKDEYDECPVCEREFVGVDMTMAGSVVFIHTEEPAITDSCSADPEGLSIETPD